MKIKVIGKWMAGIAVVVTGMAAFVAPPGISGPSAARSALTGVGYDHVVKVQANTNKRLGVAVAGNYTSAHGCPKPWWAWSQNTFDDTQTQAMLQISLSSLLSRMPVYVYTNGCDADGYPVLTQIQVQEREPPAPTPTPTPACVPSPGVQCCSSGQKCCGAVINGRCEGTCIPKANVCQ